MTSKVINLIKQTNQDFEWYPTTEEIIARLIQSIQSNKYLKRSTNHLSILDCGAGDGRVLSALGKALDTPCLYAIEKSLSLIALLESDIKLISTNFFDVEFYNLGSPIDIVYCNPPYSQYENWVTHLISQINGSTIYFLLPKKWKEKVKILKLLKIKQLKAEVIGSFNFEKAERPARVDVELVRIKTEEDRKFDEKTLFSGLGLSEYTYQDYSKKQEEKDNLHNNAIISKDGYLTYLLQSYDKEFLEFDVTLEALSKMNFATLRHLDIKADTLTSKLFKAKLAFNNKYWKEVFHNYQPINNYLTPSSQDSVLKSFFSVGNMAFTLSNVLAVTARVKKISHSFLAPQLIKFFEQLVDSCEVIPFKSNQKTWKDNNWKYTKNNTDKIKLDNRIILSNYYGLTNYLGKYSRLSANGFDILNTILAIARTLGFCVEGRFNSVSITNNEKKEIYSCLEDNRVILMTVRAYKNGNMHIQFNQEFIKRLNIEFSRHKRWIKDKSEAMIEFNLSEKEVSKIWGISDNKHTSAFLLPLLSDKQIT